MSQIPHAQQKYHSPEAEAAFLGAVLVDATALALTATVGLAPVDFYLPRHRWTFEAVTRLHDAGRGIDLATVAAALAEMGRLDEVGGREFLRELVGSAFSAANAESYAIAIKRHSVRRAALRAVEEMASLAIDDDEAGDLEAFMERINRPLGNLTRSMAGFRRTVSYAAGCDMVLNHVNDLANGHPPGLPTGLTDLDAVLHGLKGGKFYIIAARPGIGKTTLAHQAALHIIRNLGVPALLVSAEMSATEVSMRLLALEAGLDTEKIENATMTDGELTRLIDTVEGVRSGHGRQLEIMDSSSVTPDQIRSQALAMRYNGGLGLVIVDYLQLLGSGRDDKNRQAEISYISRSFKILARELDIPIVALSQLNRQVESRADKRPLLADLRDSGSLEQDSDCVLMLFRDSEYNPDSEFPGVTEIIIPKNRSGGRGMVPVFFRATTPQFLDLPARISKLNE
jgi:replicative DNA helicase